MDARGGIFDRTAVHSSHFPQGAVLVSKKLLLGLILASLVAACSNPVGSDRPKATASAPKYDGGNMMGGGG